MCVAERQTAKRRWLLFGCKNSQQPGCRLMTWRHAEGMDEIAGDI
jgi:hypothetical protein